MKTEAYKFIIVTIIFILLTGAQHVISNKQIGMAVTAFHHSEKSHPVTIAWLSDTQYYSEKYPHIFQEQIRWILHYRKMWNIQYVVHTGDIVNKAEDDMQWIQASRILRSFDESHMPYGVLAGNHDLRKKNRYQSYSLFFGENRFKDKHYYGSSYKNNRGHFDLLRLGDQPFLFLYMSWDIGKEEINWMNQVLKKFPNHIAILAFHKYLHKNGKRTFVGQRLFHDVVKMNPNVKIVLSGHYDDSEYRISKVDDNQDGKPDRKVYEILADYQGAPEGGQGFFRLFHYYPERDKMYVRTYSPYTEQFYYYSPSKYPGKDEFWIDLAGPGPTFNSSITNIKNKALQ